MKIAATIVRLIMGLLFLFASVTVLFKLMPQPELSGNIKLFMEGMDASGYLLTLIKLNELICAIAFLSGFFIPLAAVVILPLIVNFFSCRVFLGPERLPVAIFLLLGDLFLAYNYREKYKPMLKAK